jgi:hypothetical protein
MCIVVAPAVAYGIMAASVAVSTYAAYKGQQAQNDAADYNAKMQNYNASVAQAQATSAKEKGKAEEAVIRRQGDQIKGAQRSAFAAAGVEVDSGSALDTLQETTGNVELDALQTRKNAADQAWAYGVDATNYQGQATLSKMSKRSPGMAAGTTLLTGASNMASYMGRS